MATKPLNTLEVRTCERWKQWLAKHHESASEVWLVFHKKNTGRKSIDHSDALDAALCYGWIDSLVMRLDDERYAIKFTPRNPDSKWSEVNRKRYAQLQASGKLMPAGLRRSPTGNTYGERPTRPAGVPKYIEQALSQRPAALKFFDSLAPSYRRMFVGWIDSVKQQETKARRLQEAIKLLAAGKKLGLK